MTVSEYVTHFTQLSCYASNDVDTDEKKQEWFLNGLDDGHAYALDRQGPCAREQMRNTVK
jgi:hypothetical protein